MKNRFLTLILTLSDMNSNSRIESERLQTLIRIETEMKEYLKDILSANLQYINVSFNLQLQNDMSNLFKEQQKLFTSLTRKANYMFNSFNALCANYSHLRKISKIQTICEMRI